VAEHSDFRRRPLARLMRTLDLTLALSFGNRRQALGAAQAINRVHHGIRGPGYAAEEPRLLFWVQATLIDSALVAYETFVRPLPAPERDGYLREARRVGRLLGIPAALYPGDFRGFQQYLTHMLAGPELRVDALARGLARNVTRPPVKGVPDALWMPLRAVTAGLLPQRLRHDYGLPWGRKERALFASARWSLPRLLPLLPPALRVVPPARSGRFRGQLPLGGGSPGSTVSGLDIGGTR
jgi:uncharacterized protein (DUF2236 family)